MNYFIEGLQGSGKSTLVQKLSEAKTGFTAVREGDYSPVELAWCAYVDETQYRNIVAKYPGLQSAIEEKTYPEGNQRIVCYTKVMTDDRAFYRDLEQYEIYNGRIPYDRFKDVTLSRYRNWNGDKTIFECSLFQNTIEDMILFRNMPDDGILRHFRLVREALEGRDYRIVYLRSESIEGNLAVIRKERSDEAGNELWFPMMQQYFDESPFAKAHGLKGEAALIDHFRHRQELELRLCGEIFPDKSTVLLSKQYTDEDIARL